MENTGERRPSRLPSRSLVIVLCRLLLLVAAVRGAEIAPGVELLPGSFVPGRQPDGNTVVFTAPAGLIVVDTGRHVEHTRAILDFVAAHGGRLSAVINTHWHLDHIGGNPLLRREHPSLQVYASDALAGAMSGFLASYRRQLEDLLKNTENETARAQFRGELAILDAGPALAPDQVVSAPGALTIGGKTLELGLETFAVTAGDVWVRDPESGILAAGDLVTLPVPFLDTACPRRWSAALARLVKTDFRKLVPGHGPVLERPQLERYRTAFDGLLDCAGSQAEKKACEEGWLRDVGELVPEEERTFAGNVLDYYVDLLRSDPKRLEPLCGPG